MKQMFKIFSILTLLTLGAQAFNYNAVWVNSDPNIRGIKKLLIQNNGIVEAFGSCRTGTCSWGRVEYIRTQNGLLATWKRPGKGYRVVLAEAVPGNRIKVITKHMRNGQNRDKTKISYFRKRHNVGHFARSFDGDWINKEANSRGLKRLSIHRSRGQTLVHAWNNCRRQECDWGNSAATVTRHKLTAEWNQNRTRKVMTVKGIDRNRHGLFKTLEVKIKTYYRDRRNTKTRIFYLRRERR